MTALCFMNCVDCGVDAITIGEYYTVRNDVWEQVWRGRRTSWQCAVPGQEVLCIGCLETRIGRTLTSNDFTGCNNAHGDMSARMRDRLGDFLQPR